MIQEMLSAMPKEAGTMALACAIAGTVVGAGLWLTGARFSRSIVTLSLTSLGALVGMRVPAWMGWGIDGWAGGVGGAIALGVAGFAMHRLWVGVALGVVLASWAAVGTWQFAKGSTEITWPPFDAAAMTLPSYVGELWKALPPDVSKYLPYATGAAFLSGLLSALLWPRVGVILLYTLSGVSMLVSMGLMSLEIGRPQWIDMIPASTRSQLLTLGGLVVFGALVQWKVAPNAGRKASAPAPAQA
jgi:hypothetical protein